MPERISGVNCMYMGERNLTPREEVGELFADTATMYQRDHTYINDVCKFLRFGMAASTDFQ